MRDSEKDSGGGRLHIALICAHSSPTGPLGRRDTGGMSVYIREISRALACLGHDVDIFAGTTAPEEAPSKVVRQAPTAQGSRTGGSVRGIRVPAPPAHGNDPDRVRKIADRFAEAVFRHGLRERPYDVIFSHYWVSALAGLQASQRLQAPHAAMFHTLSELKRRALGKSVDSPCRLCAERRVARKSTRVIAATNREREALREQYGVSEDRTVVIPCGVDERLFRPLDRPACRRRLSLKPEEAVLLFVGRFDPIKGLERLFRAVGLVNSPRPIRLLVVGGDPEEDGSSWQEMTHRAEELAPGCRISFLGRVEQEDLPFYYNAADLFVVSSFYESFGLAILEAMACGTPVVGPPVGVLREIPQDSGAALLTPDNAPESLARGIRRGLAGQGVVPDRERIRATAVAYRWREAARRLEACFYEMKEEASVPWTGEAPEHGLNLPQVGWQ
ncbi:D-inositol-3-phosphate glycosyltransferase [Desulfacinum infernum DSM 9756]|uniref:D-inositol-3-phosphate glycosyltransferase n=1 Tax=Desulfacinum infernum DSM 9756 TaxID=1121391 RepID=A0A1M4XUY6_9BACT|nr:glycosyltransferase [Desulfacinum infernum]SHE97166.1 D-inositol-3-phosphate glycosyltransferase [Desulfacinum infernum DSM 9756]